MNDTPRSAFAEFLGTFTLMFIGAGAGAVAGGDAGLLQVALAHGFALVVIVYAWGSISGAHVNPAVTLGILLTGRIPLGKAIAYWIAQFAGAAAGGFLLLYLLGPNPPGNLGSTIGSFTPGVGVPGDPAKVLVVEAILTFFLLVAVFASGVAGRSGNAAGIAIGFVLTMDILAGGPLTGASMNPARSFGSWLALAASTGVFPSYLWLYFVGPFVGGAVGALVYSSVFLPAVVQQPVDAAAEPPARR